MLTRSGQLNLQIRTGDIIQSVNRRFLITWGHGSEHPQLVSVRVWFMWRMAYARVNITGHSGNLI